MIPQPTQQRVKKVIEKEPGIHFRGLIARTELAVGQVQHHLHQLVLLKEIVEYPVYGRMCYCVSQIPLAETRFIDLDLNSNGVTDVRLQLINSSFETSHVQYSISRLEPIPQILLLKVDPPARIEPTLEQPKPVE